MPNEKNKQTESSVPTTLDESNNTENTGKVQHNTRISQTTKKLLKKACIDFDMDEQTFTDIALNKYIDFLYGEAGPVSDESLRKIEK
ncbi:MAG: hypothetical protein CVV44_03975 [Spirochaetae bacterium HGW-Spirochaetae-1]|jgi:hypothetical protein|nr:MAG: hypothetical protein CVV44_03975 [Spirochaetae bacterium HGW-Spirochaetae-1]